MSHPAPDPAVSPPPDDGIEDICSSFGYLDGLSIGDFQIHNKKNDDEFEDRYHGDDVDRLVLVYGSSTTQIYRSSNKGIKKIIKSSANDTTVALIENEIRISNDLPPSCNARRVIKLLEEGGLVTVHFEWVNGVTLDEWLQEMQLHGHQTNQQQELQLKARLRAAIAITKSLSDYHDVGGVAHNKLSSSNIILETFGSDITANLIDLTQSVCLKDVTSAAEQQVCVDKDLEDLGNVFRKLFGNGGDGNRASASKKDDDGMDEDNKDDDDDDDDDRQNSRRRMKRGKSSTVREEAIEELPLFLASLISALPGNGSSTIRNSGDSNMKYTSVRNVLSDLMVALSKFDVYFRSSSEEASSSSVAMTTTTAAAVWNNRHHNFPVPPQKNSTFYGRQAEMSILVNSFRLVMDFGQPMMTVVSGHAGMGKTTLVNQIEKMVQERKGYLIRGKFDMADGSRPDSVLTEALDEFFGTLMETEDDDLKARMRQRIRDTVGFGIGDLVQAIPKLGLLVQVDDNLNRTGQSQQLLHRSKYLLCKLLHAIATKETPIVFVLDDLQWCDETTLSVIQTIVVDPDIQYCLHVGCYRDNETTSKAVENMISEVKRQGINMFTINLGALEKESVNMLISESLCMPPCLSQPLSSIIHTKTAGSPLFTEKFLNDGLIHFNLTSRTWEYSVKDILMEEIPVSVIEYMKSQMSKLPQSFLIVLKLASCLGHNFDRATFLRAKVKSDYDLESVLPSVCQIGFIHQITPDKFLWAHDQVREAAYGLIPKNMIESFHLLIGTRLLMNTPPDELDSAIFDILSHMNKGIRLIQTDQQKYEIAQLNLMAGQTCIKTSSFHSAAEYFMSGIKLLPQECWGSEYELAIELHDEAQDALFATGDFAALTFLSYKVINNAKKFDDKLNSYKSLVKYLVSLGRLEESISTCIPVLKELGEELPVSFDDDVLLRELMTVKTMLSQFSAQDILGHKKMTDERKLAAMGFLSSLVSASNNCRKPLTGFILVTRLMKLSLEYGLCDISVYAFSAFGSILVHGMNKDIDGGYFYANLAIKLLDVVSGAERFKARVFAGVYGLINIWRDPYQASLEPLLIGYDAGCAYGDMEFAYWNLQSYSGIALFTGQDLTKLQNNIWTYAKRAMQSKQVGTVFGIVPLLAAALELSGDTSKGDVYKAFFNTTEDDLYQRLCSQNEGLGQTLIPYSRKFSRVYMGDMEGAFESYELCSMVPGVVCLSHIVNVFADGLIALHCARKYASEDDEQKWTAIAKGIIETMKSWSEMSKWNFSNKFLLLEAEYYSLHLDNTLALEKYEASISAARKHRFVNEEGLAFYLCGQYHLTRGRKDDGKKYFAQAKKCYELWGAYSLANRMEGIISSVDME